MKNKIVKLILGAMIGVTVLTSIGMVTKREDTQEEVIYTMADEIRDNRLRMDKDNKSRWDYNKSIVVREEEEVEEIEVIEVEKENKEYELIETVYVNCNFLQLPQLSNEDIYYLRKIATCEAESQEVETMSLVMMAVINRVMDNRFPNTVYEVITQCDNGIYQFSPVIPGGSWYTMEPSEKSLEAFEMVWSAVYDYSGGCLYFESFQNEQDAKDSWFGTLEYLYQSGSIRFYK